MRKRAINYCLQLLYKWFLSHLLASGPFVSTQGTLKWSVRVMSLTSYDIRWHDLRMDTLRIIISGGEFSNVSLNGTNGCIKYNHLLAL